jgi:hypothetical protein
MSKRVRYTGASKAVVTWPPGAVYPEQTWEVEPDHWLPDDVPAALRDELAERDDWAVVQQQTSSSSGSSKSAATDEKEN